jgi:hypothetical protein
MLKCVARLAVDDDILLEVVMFVGVLCNEGTAPLLVESGLVGGLLDCLGGRVAAMLLGSSFENLN